MATKTMDGAQTPVGKLLRRAPVFVQSELTLRQVAEVLDGDTIGAVLVRTQGGFSGLVSERDIVRALAEGADPDLERADSVMTDDLITATPDTPLAEVARRMVAEQVRHVPVVDAGVVVGVLSLRDVVESSNLA